MKANELRIGNYYNQFGNIHQANASIILELENAPSSQLWCKPIPLTEEWLLKFGARPMENGFWIPVTNLKAELHFEVFDNTDEIVTTLKSQFSDLILDRIRYVHPLQNLIFALTGKELTIEV